MTLFLANVQFLLLASKQEITALLTIFRNFKTQIYPL
tara:strand:- start:312 stop:422 length:111 start_codon:yes stop_codon:yes gene_type:complete